MVDLKFQHTPILNIKNALLAKLTIIPSFVPTDMSSADATHHITAESLPRPPPLRTHVKIRPKVLAFQLEEDDMVRWSDARDLGGSDDFQKIQRFHRHAPYYLPAPCRQTILHTCSGEYRTGIVVATNFTSREDLELAKDVDRIEKMRVILGVTTPPQWRTPVLSGDDY